MDSPLNYINPDMEQLKVIVHNFLHSKNYKAFVCGDRKKILHTVKNHFIDVKAAGGLVFNNKKEVLLIKRLKKWDLPKGKLEEKESKKKGAIREVEEECGLSNLKIIRKLKPSYHVYKLNDSWVLKTTYWYLMHYEGQETLKPQTEEDITEAGWFSLSESDIKKLKTYPAIERVLRQSLFEEE